MNISKKNYIAEGSQRLVYQHPDNPNLCIKISKTDSNEHYIKREIKYTNKYTSRFKFLPLYHGSINTNLGVGHVFDLVCNSDGAVSSTLLKEKHLFSSDQLAEKLRTLYELLLSNDIVLSDIHLENILVKKIDGSDEELWLVDGVGNSDFIKICDFSHFFLKKKLIRKFTRLSNALNLKISFN